MELVGQKLGSYTIVQWLGDGAHVHAFRAHDEAHNRDVVVKVIKSSYARTEDYVQRFRREAQAALELNHPHMVRIYEYGQQGDLLYLVEEFLSGGSLLDIFRSQNGPLSPEMTHRTLDQIASVLDYAHAHGIVHGDLKPENVLYDAQGNASLSDLGITKELDKEAARSRAGLEFGNPNYMAPEEWQGGSADVRTDVYALGALLFEMLTGQLPFSAPASGGYAFMHLSHLMSAPQSLRTLRPDLSPAVETVIRRAVDKDPAQRFASAGELARAFHAARENGDMASAEAPAPEEIYAPDAPTFARLFNRADLAPAPAPEPSERRPLDRVPPAFDRQPEARPAPTSPIRPALLVLLIALVAGFILGRISTLFGDCD